MATEKKIGLVLSGGGARGFAHLGVLKALDEYGVTYHHISGTSAGAIVGAMYSQGHKPDEILKLFHEMNIIRYIRPALNIRGIVKLEKVGDFLSQHLEAKRFEDLPIPVTVAATNLSQGCTEYFDEGPLIQPILASCCLPVVFDPVQMGDDLYIDGGVNANLPVKPVQGTCEVIVGTNCNVVLPDRSKMNVRTVIERSLLMTVNYNTYDAKKHCDVFIEAPALSLYKVFDAGKADEIFNHGYEYTKKFLAESDALERMGMSTPSVAR